MTKIEERAKEYAIKRHGKGLEFAPDRMEAIDAYIRGATEQKQIDNKQLCEMILDNRDAVIDKACEWIKNYNNEHLPYTNLDCDGHCYVDMGKFAEEFRKAMEVE